MDIALMVIVGQHDNQLCTRKNVLVLMSVAGFEPGTFRILSQIFIIDQGCS